MKSPCLLRFLCFFLTSICVHSEASTTTTSSCPDLNFISSPATLILPSINLYAYKHGNVSTKHEVISTFNKSMTKFGAIILKYHSIPSFIFDNIYENGYNFFHREVEYKQNFKSEGMGTPGYEPLFAITTGNAFGENKTLPDIAECFALWNSKDNDTEFSFNATKIPHEIYNISKSYYAEMRHLLTEIHEIASFALGLNENHFEQIATKTPSYQLKYIYYPIINSSEYDEANHIRMSAHKDYLGFTILKASQKYGLQILIGDRNLWIDVDGMDEYDLLVLSGNIFNIFTNNIWKSVEHRVVNSDDGERLSIAYFTGPDQDVIIKPISECAMCTADPSIFGESLTAKQHGINTYGGGDNVNPDKYGKRFIFDDLTESN